MLHKLVTKNGRPESIKCLTLTLEILSAQVAVINIKKTHTVADDLKNKYSGRSFFEVAGKGTSVCIVCL